MSHSFIFEKHGLRPNRLLLSNQSDMLILDAKVVTPIHGHIWTGDIDMSKDYQNLVDVAKDMRCSLYVVKNQVNDDIQATVGNASIIVNQYGNVYVKTSIS